MIKRTLLVTSPARRRAWETLLRDDSALVVYCAGPNAQCPLLSGRTPCPLHGEADAAVYDQDVVTRDLLVALLVSPPRIPIHFAVANGSRPPHIMYALAGGSVRQVAGA